MLKVDDCLRLILTLPLTSKPGLIELDQLTVQQNMQISDASGV